MPAFNGKAVIRLCIKRYLVRWQASVCANVFKVWYKFCANYNNMYIKRTLLFICLILVCLTCTKENYSWRDDPSLWTSQYPPSEVICDGPPFNNDTCQTYYDIWKDLFLTKNQISQEYFDSHITQGRTLLHRWNDGISFDIEFTVKVDWAEKKLDDQFVIYIFSKCFPQLDVPRDTLLTKSQIDTIVSGFYFSSHIYKVNPVDELKYSSLEEAVKALRQASGNNSIDTGSVFYEQGDNDSLTIGNPCLESHGTINWNANQCISCYLDLVTGKTMVEPTYCYIIFCFVGETQISQPNGLTKPINDIRIGDKILSYNFNSMKVEEDIVMNVDSVFHDNLVKIEFNDFTINVNTSDHPYYIKGKGWCSVKPIETLKKYKIKAYQLQVGDTCLKYDRGILSEVIIRSIANYNESGVTYNISKLKNNNNYFANGILVSNESGKKKLSR